MDKQNTIKFFNSNGTEIEAKTKPFISADMIVEHTKIIRKYAKKYDDFLKFVTDKDIDNKIHTCTDAEFYRMRQFAKVTSADDIFDRLQILYQDEINREIIPIITDISTITDKDIIKMLNDNNDKLWGQQDIYSFRSICKELQF